MIKNKRYLIIMLLFILTFFLAGISQAKIVTLYQSEEPQDIYTREGMSTILEFKTEISFAQAGNTSYFNVKKDSNLNKLIVEPLKPGVMTNLTVITKDDNKYVFYLKELEDDSKNDLYDLVSVRPKANFKDSEKVDILRGEGLNIENSKKNLFEVKEADDYSVKTEKVEVIVKRAAEINNINESIFWFRLKNIHNQRIKIYSIGIKDRKLNGMGTKNFSEYIAPGDYTDYFLIAEGKEFGNSLIIKVNINGELKEIKLSNIPFQKSDFRMYQIGG